MHWIGIQVDDLHALQNLLSLDAVRVLTDREVQVADDTRLVIRGLINEAPQYGSTQAKGEKRRYAGACSARHCSVGVVTSKVKLDRHASLVSRLEEV